MIESSQKSAPSPSPTPAPLIASEDILDSYLREIRDTPLLSGPEQRRLCEQMESAERRFREAIVSIPATARHVVALWRERRESGRVSGALSRFHRDGSGRNWSRVIDEKLGVVERDLAELADLHAARAPREALLALRDTLACHLEEAEIALPCLIGLIEPLEQASTRETIAEAGGRVLFSRRLGAARDGLAALTDSKNRFITHNLRLVIRCAKS